MTTAALARRAAGQSFLVLVLLLPALVAGLSLEAEPAPGEWERLVAAITGDDEADESDEGLKLAQSQSLP